eukprot:792362_1
MKSSGVFNPWSSVEYRRSKRTLRTASPDACDLSVTVKPLSTSNSTQTSLGNASKYAKSAKSSIIVKPNKKAGYGNRRPRFLDDTQSSKQRLKDGNVSLTRALSHFGLNDETSESRPLVKPVTPVDIFGDSSGRNSLSMEGDWSPEMVQSGEPPQNDERSTECDRKDGEGYCTRTTDTIRMTVDKYIQQTSFATVPALDSQSGSRDSACTNVRTSSENLHRQFEIARKQRSKLFEPFRTGAKDSKCSSLKHSKMEFGSEGSPNNSSPNIAKPNFSVSQSKSISPHSSTSISHVAKAEHTQDSSSQKSNTSKFYQSNSPLEPSDDIRIPESDSIIWSPRGFSEEISRNTHSPPRMLPLRMSISSDVHDLGNVFLSQSVTELHEHRHEESSPTCTNSAEIQSTSPVIDLSQIDGCITSEISNSSEKD